MLWKRLLWLGEWMDQADHQVARSRSGALNVQIRPPAGIEEPRILTQSCDMLVVCKPPGWEVDSTANETDALCLSGYLQHHLDQRKFPLIHQRACGFGFVHRLDVASSGLILVGKTFKGLLCLQWQKSLYEIRREYQVVSYDLEGLRLRSVDAKVNASGKKSSRTLTEDRGQPAVSHLLTQAHLMGGPAVDFRYCIIVIRIHTGRRHQIRAHTRAVGHPTACDGWYAPSSVLLLPFHRMGPAPPRAWIRTPRWDGELSLPPKELEGQVY